MGHEGESRGYVRAEEMASLGHQKMFTGVNGRSRGSYVSRDKNEDDRTITHGRRSSYHDNCK